MTAEATLVHGLGTEWVEPDWPLLTTAEVTGVLAAYGKDDGVRITWHSPRPLSSAALLETRTGRFFVKRHHRSVRTPAGLAEEHDFLAFLGGKGIPVVEVLRAADGRTAVEHGKWTYEVHTVGTGEDLYRDAISWSPFSSSGHAAEAGAQLARLHLAAADYTAPRRAAQPLVTSFEIFSAADPVRALERFAAARPALADYLRGVDWRADLATVHLPFFERLRPSLSGLEPLWTHGDWHASNLLWTETGTVATVLDFGLSDLTTAVHDLATAVERNIVQWLDLDTLGPQALHLDHLDALLDGYLSVRPLSPAESAALPELLPLVQADFALSEVDYFHGIVGSPSSTALAYDYFTGHTRWFSSPEGVRLLDRIRARTAL